MCNDRTLTKSEPTHPKRHGSSLEQVCERKSRPDRLVPVDGSKVPAIEGITMPAKEKILRRFEDSAALPNRQATMFFVHDFGFRNMLSIDEKIRSKAAND
jgi:hypothetical protein